MQEAVENGRLHEFSRHRKACLIDAYSLSQEVGFPWQNKVVFDVFLAKFAESFLQSQVLFTIFFSKSSTYVGFLKKTFCLFRHPNDCHGAAHDVAHLFAGAAGFCHLQLRGAKATHLGNGAASY